MKGDASDQDALPEPPKYFDGKKQIYVPSTDSEDESEEVGGASTAKDKGATTEDKASPGKIYSEYQNIIYQEREEEEPKIARPKNEIPTS